MAIVHQSFTTNSGTSTSATFNKPTGTASGDVLVAFFLGSPSSAPTGWVQFASDPFLNLWGYYKVAGGSEPASYTWPQSSSAGFSGGISRYSGVSNTTPMDVAATTANGFTGTSPTAPSVTTVTANAMLIGACYAGSGAGTITPPSGMTERWEVAQSSNDVEHASTIQPAAGATGSKAWSITTTSGWSVALGALRPASGALSVQGVGIPGTAAMGDATLSLAGVTGVGIPPSSAMGVATLTTGQTVIGKGISSTAAMGVAMLTRDSDPQELIFIWNVDQRSRAIRLVFETTEPMARFRVREFEVLYRLTGGR